MKKFLGEKYSPLYFLAALGAGGLSVSFFIYLFFLIPHKGTPLVTYNHIAPYFINFSYKTPLIALALIGIIVFAFYHFKLLIWNLKEYKAYKKTASYESLVNSNAEVTLMAIPLTFAMTINACFVLGAVFVPNLWSVVEYMFPFAILAFGVTGYYSLKIFTIYFSRIIINGDFNFAKNNNLSQMISIFAFSMVGVGFAAPGAMSHFVTVNAIGIFGAIFFMSIAILLTVLKFILGFKNMLEHGISAEASPSLWIAIPILTLIGITLIRINFGMGHHFYEQDMQHIITAQTKTTLFTLTSTIVSLQIITGLIGFSVMKGVNYFNDYIYSDKKSPVSFALICPGVASFVFGFFFINFGLEFNGVVEKYSIVYFALMIPLIYIQFKTIVYFFKLKNKFEI